jgi:hypothetical protein
MIFEDGNVLDYYHVDLGEYLRSHRNKDSWYLVHNVLVQSQLIQIGLEKEEEEDDYSHQQHIGQVENNCE